MPPKESKDGRQSRSRPSTRRSTPVNTPSSSKPSAPLPQPAPAPPKAISAPVSVPGGVNHDSEPDWSEPPLATPKASYKEYDDKAPMNISTQHMQPLGELPSAKMLEATKRPFPHQGKKKGKQPANNGNIPWAGGSGSAGKVANGGPVVGGGGGGGGGGLAGGVGGGGTGGGGTGGSGGVGSPATSVGGSSRATQTVKVKAPVTTPVPVSAASPGGMTIGSSGSPPANPSTPVNTNGPRPGTVNGAWLNGNAPNSKTPQGRQRLSMVVDAAIERSAQVGNVDLGRAIKKLYDESLSNSLLADLLDAVLAQKATAEQIHQFQTYVRNARDPNATSAEPTSAVNGAQPPDGAPPPKPQEAPQPKPQERPQDTVATNGSASTGGNNVKKEKLSKKEKKKNGVKKHQHGEQPGQADEDTDSDLSSVCSDMFDDHQKTDSVPASTPHQRSRVPSPVHSFTPIQSEYHKNNDSEHPAKRQKLPTFDEIKQDSSIRDPPPASLAVRAGKGTGNSRKRPRSPSISTPPPPVSASSSVTPPSSVAAPTSAPVPSSAASIPVQPPKKKNKTNKIKISPVKKPVSEPFVVTAGIGDLSDHRRVRYGSEEVSENEDVCAVCNGPGRFLCCERCPRSFHFTCLNPPLEEIPEGMWFCNKCMTQHNPPVKPPRGLFSELIDGINRRNPTSFRLPPDIRGYFVGVETGTLGEYVDVRDNKTQRFSKSGFVEEYDTHKLKDKQGNAILCHHCGKSAVDGQRIISCDFCPLSWHLDCIGPMPMSNPPPTQKKWMCPAHADLLQPRRPKKAPIVDTYLRRGFKNNGVIEIENEEETAYEEVMMNGVVYRLPERGIKLDFIEKVKTGHHHLVQKQRKFEQFKTKSITPILTQPVIPLPGLENRPIIDQQLVQYLLEFAGKYPILTTISGENINSLIQALISQATPTVKALLTEPQSSVASTTANQPLSPAASLDTNTTSTSEHEKQQLLALQELIVKRLQAISSTQIPPPPPQEAP